MKIRIRLNIIFLILSVIWVSVFTYLLVVFTVFDQEVAHIKDNIGEIENLKYYDRYLKEMEIEYETTRRQSLTSKSTAEFIATLPKIGEFSGIQQIKIQNKGVKLQDNLEITELVIVTSGLFPNIANFIDVLERSQLPIQIASLQFKKQKNNVSASMIIRIFKKIIRD